MVKKATEIFRKFISQDWHILSEAFLSVVKLILKWQLGS